MGRAEAGLKRVLNLKDLVFLNISCIVGLSSLGQVSQFGFASLPLYVLALITFLIPSGLTVAELNARIPAEGGFYLWTRKSFGDIHGYITAWSYWVSNIVWLPTAMLLISGSALYMFGDEYSNLSDNPWYNGVVCLGVLWFVTILNILGLERAKWIQNVGGIATWACVILLVGVGIVFALKFGSTHPFEAGKLVPDFTDMSIIPFFAIIALSLGGLELAPVMAGEIENPKKNIPKAIIISAISVGAIYILATLMLVLILPEGEINIIAGIAQAFKEVSFPLGSSWVRYLGVLLLVLSTIGLFGAWMTGTARIPFVIGLDHYLPDIVARTHPKWGSPYVSLLMQAVVLTILFISSIAGATVKEAFLILLDMSIILYFIPFLYMFAALVWQVTRNPDGEGIIGLFQNNKVAVWVTATLGFGITLLSGIISAIPTKEIENKELFVLKVVGGSALILAAGLVVFFLKKQKKS